MNAVRTWFGTRLNARAEVYDVVMGALLIDSLVEDRPIPAIAIAVFWALPKRRRS